LGLKAAIKKLLFSGLYSIARKFYRKLRAVWYAGNKHECPVCGGKYRTFLPYGMNNRANAQCPGCGLVERHRLLWLYLSKKTDFFTNENKVLDIAPMSFFQDKCQVLPNLEYLSADIESPLAMVKMDITEIQYPANHFNCIICYHVLEHVSNDMKALREFFRVLKPGGWAILQSPIDYNRDHTFEDPNITDPHERAKAFGQHDHVRLYGRDYPKRLAAAGFKVRVDDFIGEMDSELIEKYRLEKGEKIHYCTKPA